MAKGLESLGYESYRRSDAAAMRQLQRGPMSIGRLGAALGVSRQAARKVANGLEERGLATIERDSRDSRQLNVVVTPEGEAYAKAVRRVIERLNRNLSRRVDPADLAGADAVLRAVVAEDPTAKRLAEHLPPP